MRARAKRRNLPPSRAGSTRRPIARRIQATSSPRAHRLRIPASRWDLSLGTVSTIRRKPGNRFSPTAPSMEGSRISPAPNPRSAPKTRLHRLSWKTRHPLRRHRNPQSPASWRTARLRQTRTQQLRPLSATARRPPRRSGMPFPRPSPTTEKVAARPTAQTSPRPPAQPAGRKPGRASSPPSSTGAKATRCGWPTSKARWIFSCT